MKLLLGFSWIEKGGLFLNVALFTGPRSVFMTESVDGKQRKGFYVVGYSDEPCLGKFIFLLWMVEGEREIRTCTTCCLRDIKAMETVKQSSTNQNGGKCLREAVTI